MSIFAHTNRIQFIPFWNILLQTERYRNTGVSAEIYTSRITQQLQLDINRHNQQYAPINVSTFNNSHDRFLIIDDKVYLIGASIKDLGKRWFAFTELNAVTPSDLLSRL